MASADVHNAHWVDKQSRAVFAGEVDAHVTKPRLLDAFCGAGGCARGYQLAGFYVVGVDNRPQPRYVGDEFVQADALEYIREHGHEFDAIHASPPCQRWAGGFVKDRSKHPDHVATVRDLLVASGLPYVIENVRGAPLLDATMICGGGLGLKSGDLQLHRHRYFETNFALMGVACSRIARLTVSVVGNGTPTGNRITIGRNPSIAEKREAMGIAWMSRGELSEAIPPAYTEHIGGYLLAEVRRRSLERAA
jgi:DNA (cytosine-5)-methyltransferase 1